MDIEKLNTARAELARVRAELEVATARDEELQAAAYHAKKRLERMTSAKEAAELEVARIVFDDETIDRVDLHQKYEPSLAAVKAAF